MVYDSETLANEIGEVCWGILRKPLDIISVSLDGKECGPHCYWLLAYGHLQGPAWG